MYGLRGYGLGFTYNDLLNSAGLQNCDPKDVPCVAGNQQIEAAVEDLWVSKYESDPNTANLPTPSITVTPNESQAAINQFKQNMPDNQATIQVGSGPVYTDPQLEQYYMPPAAPKVVVPPPLTPPPSNLSPLNLTPPPGYVPNQIQTPAAQGAPALTSTLTLPDFSSGFSFSSLPWYVWAGGAAVAFFALKGGR